ncbi:MAG: ABC transporter permease [Chloroflexota bacterium]
MNWRRVLSVMRKEWWHITRDKTSFILLVISPVLVMITMGYAFSIDIKDVGIGIMDQDLTPLSRQYLSQIDSTDALRIEAYPTSLNVQVIVDCTDPNTAGHAIQHIGAHTEYFAAEQQNEQLLRAGYSGSAASPIDLRLRPWYNPSLRYTVSMIPALVGIVLSVPAMAASLALSREREWGTLEGLIATPIGKNELILGKLVPYIIAGMLSIPLIMITAVYGYNVPFKGSIGLYLLLSLLYLFSTMSIAIFISVFIKSQQAAIMASMMIFLFSGFFLSGLLIPFSLMGPLIKMEAMLMPTTHFVIISRNIFTKGAGMMEIRFFVLALAIIGLIFFALTVLMFKKKL